MKYSTDPFCVECGDPFDYRRAQLGYKTCLDCGSPTPVRTIAAIGKSGYQLITDKADLKGLNPKDPK